MADSLAQTNLFLINMRMTHKVGIFTFTLAITLSYTQTRLDYGNELIVRLENVGKQKKAIL
jgi:hypothetical protein